MEADDNGRNWQARSGRQAGGKRDKQDYAKGRYNDALGSILVTNGIGREAIAFYERALEAEVVSLQTFGDQPGHDVSEEMKDRIMHAHLKVGESDLMLSDISPSEGHRVGNHLSIAITLSDAAKAKRIFEALAEGGNVSMPLQETFWSPAYGHLTDKYGVDWQISTAPEQDS